MGYIEERKGRNGSTSFRAQVRLKGHAPVTETFGRRSDVKAWIAKTETSMREGEFLSVNEAKKHTLAETIDRFIKDKFPHKDASGHQVQKLEWFKREIGFKRLSDVTPAVIADCRLKLKAEMVRGKGRSGPTCNRFCSALSSVFEYAKDVLYWTRKNPVREVKRDKEHEGVVRFLSDDEKRRLIAACETDEDKLILPLVITALSTGMRKEELHCLKWEDVDLQKGAILLHNNRTKNGVARRVPLKGKALQLLKDLYRTQQSAKLVRLHSFVFPHPASDRPFELRGAWERVRTRANLEDFRFHDLRHSCASFLAMNGASLLEIAEILGHKTLVMVKRYSHLAESHTASVVERMNEKVFGA